ncbi:MAG: hypothetical protein COA63_013950 [Methylophaga sp.]|nr:hypothetical protein [Methylophaga sp.]
MSMSGEITNHDDHEFGYQLEESTGVIYYVTVKHSYLAADGYSLFISRYFAEKARDQIKIDVFLKER